MMVYDPEEPTRAAHVGYVAQSQTPYHDLNPGYRVYTVDGDYEGSSYVSVCVCMCVCVRVCVEEEMKNNDKFFFSSVITLVCI